MLIYACIYMYAAAKLLQSCLTLCDPRDSSPPGSPVPGILQARTLEWVAISFSNAGKWKVKVKSLTHVDSSRPHGLQPTRLLRPWDFPGKSTGVGCHCLLHIYLLNIFKCLFLSFVISIKNKPKYKRQLLLQKYTREPSSYFLQKPQVLSN